MLRDNKKAIASGILSCIFLILTLTSGRYLRFGSHTGITAETTVPEEIFSFGYTTAEEPDPAMISDGEEMTAESSVRYEESAYLPLPSEALNREEKTAGSTYREEISEALWPDDSETTVVNSTDVTVKSEVSDVFYAGTKSGKRGPAGFIFILSFLAFVTFMILYAGKLNRKTAVRCIELPLTGLIYSLFFFALCLYAVNISFRAPDGIESYGLEMMLITVFSVIFVVSARMVISWISHHFDVSWSPFFRKVESLSRKEQHLWNLTFYPLIMMLLLVAAAVALALFLVKGHESAAVKFVTAASLTAAAALMALDIRILVRNIRIAGQMQQEIAENARMNERYRINLVANVSHDIRTPLTSVIGYGELLKKEALTEEGRENLDRLNDKAAYLLDMVESLFELTKVSSGELKAREEALDLIRLLEQTLALFEDDLINAGLRIRRGYAVSEAPLYSDGTLLNQVFSNLFSNAVKYAMPGTRVHVTLTEEGDTYLVRVINVASYEMDFDTEEILERFVRADESRHSEGSGLGLAIAKTYTEALGGQFFITADGDQFSANVKLPRKQKDVLQKK